MSRLIDADLLKQNCKCTGGFNDNFICVDLITLAEVIDNQPTAFDTEKVVEQLMIIHDEGYCPNEDSLECVLNKSCSDCYREKIADIVKKGGVE